MPLSEIIQEEAKAPHKNSLTAKSGFKAEDIFRTDPDIRSALETYFANNYRYEGARYEGAGKKIVSLQKVHGKKYDTKVHFEDGSSVHLQNKKIEQLGGRGDSFDRRHIKDTFHNPNIRRYLTLLTLVRKSKMETFMSEDQKIDFMNLCNDNLEDISQYIRKTLIGEKEDEMNHYWCIMKTNKDFTKKEIYILSSEKLLRFMENSIKIDIKLKKNGTCLHLSPYIALQRKGGGETDHSPNHIQAKLKITQEILDLCDILL